MKKLALLLVVVMLFATGCGSSEEVFPNEQITIHCPFAVGGNLDLKARLVAKYLEEELGVTVVVENNTGSAGLVGTTQFFQEETDGYNILFTANNSYCLAPLVTDALYETDDLTAICGFDIEEFAMFSCPEQSGIESLDDLLSSDSIIHSTGGASTVQYLVSEYILSDVDSSTLQHDSQPEGITNLMGGHSDIMLAGYATALQYVESGDITPLFTTSETAWEDYAGYTVPTLQELGIDLTFESFTFFGVAEGTDEEVVDILEEAMMNVFANEEFLAEMETFEPIYKTVSSEEADEIIAQSTADYIEFMGE